MIFLDFDGVLFDTVKEAYVVSLLATHRCCSIDKIEFSTSHYFKFSKLRYLVSRAWHYKYLLEELEYNKNLTETRSCFLNKINDNCLQYSDYYVFEENFFSAREQIKKDNYISWLKLNSPFQFLNEIKFLFNEFSHILYIVTTKDKQTVFDLLSLEGILFDKDRIFDKDDFEKFKNKKGIISKLIYDNDSIFIDDSDKHIKDCCTIKGLKCLQPEWGYVGSCSKLSSIEVIMSEINNLIGRTNV